jgi:SAM-dependent methyltransferase
MPESDLASPEHWTARYEMRGQAVAPGWKPCDYLSRATERILKRGLARKQPASILEVGCGDSTWLPYLAKRTGAQVAGIDYSEVGCRLAKARLDAEGVAGEIYFQDIFSADPAQVGQYDFVYSLGVVEHFADLESILAAISQFTRPGGIVVSEAPNLRSIHGLLSWIWQPAVLARHVLLSKRRLVQAYQNLGFKGIESGYCGVFSLGIVAWGLEPRWPALERRMLPAIRGGVRTTERILSRLGGYEAGTPALAPFLYVIGQKPALQPLKERN